jgi:hypothetical protein
MTNDYAKQLGAAVLTTFLAAFAGAWLLGLGSHPIFAELGNLSLAQKAAAAGGAAVLHLLAGVFVAPHVGDPSSPSLLPARFVGKVAATLPEKQAVVVSIDDVLSAVLKRLASKLPPGVTVTAEDVANELIGEVWKPPTAVPKSP